MIFTEEDKRSYDEATECHIRGMPEDEFDEGGEKKMNAITIKLLNVISAVKMNLLKVTKRRTKSETTAT